MNTAQAKKGTAFPAIFEVNSIMGEVWEIMAKLDKTIRIF